MGRPAPRPLLLALLWLALCRGRVVRVPAGSLVRVVGTELVIPCNVSDYDGPSEQNFDWSFSSSGSSFVELASTWEVGFGAQLYRERLQRGEILLRRTANDAVELHIKDIQPSDQGHYKCSTPSTDATVQGNYEDTVQVKVLADALHVAASPLSSPGPGLGRSLSLHLGEPFELRCEAATTSPLHTHLALLWELRHGATRQRVLALTREGRLHPGPGYEQRYHGGDVRLDTVGSDGYRLSVNRALAADQGTYRCVVSEWIEEQGAWQEIQEKAVDVATVVIQPTVLRAAVGRNVSVAEGKELDLSCNITTDRADDVRPEVTWYFSRTPDRTMPGPHVLARLDRDSLVHSSPHVALSHVDARSYHLLVRDVSKENSGYYSCHVALWVPGHNRSWHKVAEATSAPVGVDVTWLEPDYQVYLNASKVPEFSDDLTELECRVVDKRSMEGSVRVTVSWYYRVNRRDDDVVTSELLAAMDGDWTLKYGERSKQRAQDGDFIFSKERADTFSFRIQRTTEEDRGNYYCVVSAWTRQRNSTWVKSRDVFSKPVHIFWASEDSVLVVKARQPKPFFAAGNTFEMTCKVSSQNIKSPRYSVLITAEKPAGDLSSPNETKYIISLDQDAVVRLENWTDASRVDGVVLEKVQEDEFRYRMYQTQVSDAGLYRCMVTAWSPVRGSLWREAATSLSNPIEIDFQTSGPIFNASVYSDTPSVIRGDLIKLFCIVTVEGAALDPDDMAFDVSWFVVHSFGLDKDPILLSSLDRKGIVSTARRDWKSDLSLERVGVLEFLLQVHGSEDQDFGNYYCSALSWGWPGPRCRRRPLLRPLLRTRGAWRVMASSGCEDLRGQELEESFLYFAYGSNLLTERIQLRNPSAAFCCVARLQDFKLDFGNFQGKASETWHGGIATIFQSPGDEVWGVVWKMNKSNLSSLDKQEGVNSGTYAPMEINVYTQEGKKITCRSYQMRNYESAPPSPQYKKVICMGAKENGLPLEYQKKLNAIEPNDYRGRVSEEIEDIIKSKETNTH